MLRTEHVQPYREVGHYQCHNGFIVWRVGTGGNVEILHLKTETARQKTGTHLLKTMLERLKERPPYATIFGFSRVSNEAAHAFYRAMGFELTRVKGVYDEGAAVVFSARYSDLMERHCANDS
jgi:ribosomal protein S18 acetylase RimI-like enzyme